jgi:uncharacterized protein (DUF58 family)
MATLAAIALAVPLALDGESATGNSAGIAIIAAVSLVSGYVLLAGIWWFFFRDGSKVQRREARERAASERARDAGRRERRD